MYSPGLLGANCLSRFSNVQGAVETIAAQALAPDPEIVLQNVIQSLFPRNEKNHNLEESGANAKPNRLDGGKPTTK